MAENLDYYRSQIVLARTEIKNLRQQLQALKHEHTKDIIRVKSLLDNLRCSTCAETATSVISINANPNAADVSKKVEFQHIGVIETSFQNKRGVPRQPVIIENSRGTVVINLNVFNNPEHALQGLEEFSHMWIIFYFHQTESASTPAKVAPPRLGGERRGVFSTRSPHRPCPIGLSLVKIHSIEGNKISFVGVDMVNGTPVLDIKPYIPQYDFPALGSSVSPLCMIRPPTEGTNDAIDNNQVPVANDGNTRISSQPQNNEDLTSPENLPPIVTPLPESPCSEDALDAADFNDASPIHQANYSERGAPDGQERFTPPNSSQILSLTDGIRVPTWITNPPSQTYQVSFTDDASHRLQELIGDRADSFKTNIQSLLSEDPRSQYVRTRYPDHEYSCVLEDLCISCVFDANSGHCTIIAVRSADDLQC